MQSFQRAEVQTLVNRLNEEPHHLISIEGPRQAGKTTIVAQALRQIDRPYRHMLLDEPAEFDAVNDQLGPHVRRFGPRSAEWLEDCWNRARQLADREPNGYVLALDEIHVIPDWSSTVKGLWDRDRLDERNLHVILLSSAPLRYQDHVNESLLGRFEVLPVSHWSLAEMNDAFGFTLDEFVYFGGYPGSAKFKDDEERWISYMLDSIIRPNVERDILALHAIDKPALLKQLFEVGVAYSGQILSYNKLTGQLQDAGNTTTLARYLQLLSNAQLLTGLSKFSPSTLRTRTSTPKLNVFNTGLMAAGSGYSFQEARSDRTYWGRLVESAVGAHLLNSATSRLEVEYWREGGSEVDFVLRMGQRSVGIEVRSGRRFRNPSGLELFSQRFAPVRTLLVGTGGIDLGEFLSVPPIHWFS